MRLPARSTIRNAVRRPFVAWQRLPGLLADWATEFIKRHAPFFLLIAPNTLNEFIGLSVSFVFGYLINDYLLHSKIPVDVPWNILVPTEIIYWLFCIAYLWPVFRVSRPYRRGESIPPQTMQKVRTRLYNYPMMLVAGVYVVWFASLAAYYYQHPELIKFGPFILVSMVSTMLTAIVVYYLADFLNRAAYIPYFFPDGEMQVQYRFVRKPSLFNRFLDLFLVNAIMPTLVIAGVVYTTMQYGSHDEGELWRLFVCIGSVSAIFWSFGGLLTLMSAWTFVNPLNSMVAAAERLQHEDYAFQVPVQSDDQLGKLQTTINRAASELNEKTKIKTLFGHYVSPEIRDLILGGRVKTEGDAIEAVVLFSDIRSFTLLTEQHPPEKIIRILNVHFSRIVDIVRDNQGFVDKFIGDAVMAVFDAEFCENKHRELALNAAMAILEGMQETNRLLAEEGVGKIRVGIGMACGRVIRGNVGSTVRRELTVIGDTVNVASRLESMTKELDCPLVLTRDSIHAEVDRLPGFVVQKQEAIRLRGRDKPVEIVGLMQRG